MTGFARRLLDWFDDHGRRDLPWQRTSDVYAVWLSEVMLQQTQVATVIPYFERFVRRFPDVASLADADVDEVLHLWTGLGYYARARNLHRAARQVRDCHGGHFPTDFDALCALPGIGRSTAGAILAFTHGQRQAILDGNVKRVLARWYRIDGYPGEAAVAARLWAAAERNTPHRRVADYTQAIMDLGAKVCVRSRPRCSACPVAAGCRARRVGDTERYPGRRVRREMPRRETVMVMIRDDAGRLLLERRPPAGIWGGLWSFPECGMDADVRRWCADTLGLAVEPGPAWPTLRHGFTHYRLDIQPVPVRLDGVRAAVMEGGERVWYNPGEPDVRGLAAPVKRLLTAWRTHQ